MVIPGGILWTFSTRVGHRSLLVARTVCVTRGTLPGLNAGVPNWLILSQLACWNIVEWSLIDNHEFFLVMVDHSECSSYLDAFWWVWWHLLTRNVGC